MIVVPDNKNNQNHTISYKDTMSQLISSMEQEQSEGGEGMNNLQGLNTEYANSNKWYAFFPLANVLGKKYSNLEVNLTRFSIPQLVMGSSTTTYKGYEYERPTRLIDAGSKEITLEYIVDEKWQNYKSLYKWCSALEGQLNKVVNTSDVNNITFTDFVNCRIYLLDHFKNEIISFTYHNCWIKIFQDLALEGNNADEVKHSITLCYSNYTIDDVMR